MIVTSYCLMANDCPTCYKRIQNHAYKIKCFVCKPSEMHINYPEWSYLFTRTFSRLVLQKLAVTHIRTSYMIRSLLLAVYHIDNISSLNSSDLFHPFEMNDVYHNSFSWEIDPNLCFYYSINFDISLSNKFVTVNLLSVMSSLKW